MSADSHDGKMDRWKEDLSLPETQEESNPQTESIYLSIHEKEGEKLLKVIFCIFIFVCTYRA